MFRSRLLASRTATLIVVLLLAAAGHGSLGSQDACAASPANGEWQAASTTNRVVEQSSADHWSPAQASSIKNDASARPAPVPPRSTTAKTASPGVSPTRQSQKLATSTGDEAAPIARIKVDARPQPGQSPWRLPNAGQNHASSTATLKQNGDRPRLKQPAMISSAREPQAFQPIDDAKPLSAAVPNNRTTAAVQNQTLPASVAPTSAAAQRTATPPAATRPRMIPNSNTARTRPTRGNAASNRSLAKSTASLWDAITVAFEGPDPWNGEPENLPLPTHGGRSVVDSHELGEFIPGYAEFSEDGYVPGGDSGTCCGDAGCGDGVCDSGCACGCGGDVGYACEPGCGCAGGNCGSDEVCDLGCDDNESCHSIRIRVPKWQEFTVFGGVQGFKGPYDQTRDSGNFGFHEGFNTGFKLPYTEAGYQIGFQAVHSQLNGDKNTNIADPHTQMFTTVGFYQRARDGIQMGVAWDMLRDERFGSIDFHQLRGELSLIDCGRHELGVSAAVHLNDHEVFEDDRDDPTIMYQSSDQYLLFYRLHGARGGEGRFFGGFNDDDDGIIGADLLVPLQDRWSLQSGFTYLIPDEDAGREGATQEAWNIGMTLVWHWDCRARKSHASPYRPLFNVADNGSLIIDERLGSPGN